MAQTNGNGNGKRQINPRSLENLKLGAEARRQGKERRNCSLLPETIQWLEEHGNASFMIDTLVASAKSGALKLNSNDAHSTSEAELRELRSRLEQAEKLVEAQRLEIEQLQISINAHDSNCAELQRENQRLLEDLKWQLTFCEKLADDYTEQIEKQKLEIEQLAQLERAGAEQLAQEVGSGLKAATALKEALKAKAIGQIKTQIRYALDLIDDI